MFQVECERACDSQQIDFDHETVLQVAVEVTDGDPENRNGNSNFEGVSVDIANDLFS